MKLFYCCILFLVLALPSFGQRPGSGLVIARLEDFIELTKHVAEASASTKSHAEARPEINRLLVIAAFDFVQITRNAPSREAYLESMDHTLAQLDPLMVLPEDRVQVAEFYDELLEMAGVESSEGRLDEFARRPPKVMPAPTVTTTQAQAQGPASQPSPAAAQLPKPPPAAGPAPKAPPRP
ncbi:MAG: hypothetical protein M3Y54_15850 [Bacteroidota bacterium]|nr:hypothetical protein [Bacteroidota bacterium]